MSLLRHLPRAMDYSPLLGAIPNCPKAVPQDIDGCADGSYIPIGIFTNTRRNRRLFLENKQIGEFETMSEGAKITMTDLSRCCNSCNDTKCDGNTVIIVEHNLIETKLGAFLFDPKRVMKWKTDVWINMNITDFRNALFNWWYK